MKQNFTLILFLLFTVFAKAVPVNPKLHEELQPDGSIVFVRLGGDEFSHWIESEDGLLVKKNSNGFYEYLLLENDSLIFSGVNINSLNHNELEKIKIEQQSDNFQSFLLQQRSKAISEWSKQQMNENQPKLQSHHSNTSGHNKVLCIMVQFSDVRFTYSKQKVDSIWNHLRTDSNSEVGSVRDFYLENSYGQLDVQAVVVGPYTAPHNKSYYTSDTDGDEKDYTRAKNLVWNAITFAKDSINFGDFDVNGDGCVDLVHIICAGYGAESHAPNCIWSHYGNLVASVIQGTKYAHEYIITSELQSNNGSTLCGIGTICHEYGHALGAPDFYDTKHTTNRYTAIGYYDVMASGAHSYSGRRPAHHNPYTKYYIFHWGTVHTIYPNLSIEYTMPLSTTSSVFYKIGTITANEYFLLENKPNVYSSSGLEISGGLCIYHIHKDIANQISTNDVNTTHPLKCYLVNARSTYSQPTSNISSYGDVSAIRTYPGSSNKRFFTNTSVPANKAWNGTTTGVDICFIRKSGDNIVFAVNPKISGPDVLCDSAYYSIPNIPSTATVQWSCIDPVFNIPGSHAVVFPEGNNTTEVLIKQGEFFDVHIEPNHSIGLGNTNLLSENLYSPYIGQATIQAKVTCGGEQYTMTKVITIPNNEAPILSISNNMWIYPNSQTIQVTNCADVSDSLLKWEVVQSNGRVMPVTYGRSKTITPAREGLIGVKVTNLSCGSDGAFTMNQYIVFRYSMGISCINPIRDNQLEYVVYEEKTESPSIDTPKYEGQYTIELWSDKLGRIVSETFENQPYNKLSLPALPSGIYQVMLIIDGKIVDTQNVIKK